MIGNKDTITKALVFANEDQEFYLEEIPLKADKRTKSQNNAYYRCFSVIAKKMGITSSEVKQNSLKALFGTRNSKLGGIEYENAIIGSTTELNKEQATLLIETLNKFGKTLGCGDIITPREILELFNNN